MVTVFTPTYNRAYRLPKLYESLKRQTSNHFEWIIVDDGSTDDTKALVERWLKNDNGFDIRYIYKENGGKHTAINAGVKAAKYDWFFIVDSDDYVTDDAVEKIESWTENLRDEKIAGVSGTSVFPDKTTIGEKIQFAPGEYVDAKNTERGKYGLGGDKAEIFRTAILRKYPFPVFEGERFLSEICVWNKIAEEGYKVRWYNYPIKVCEYLDDGLTSQNKDNQLLRDNFEGYLYSMRYYLMSQKGLNKIKRIYHFAEDAKSQGYGTKKVAEVTGVPDLLVKLIFFMGSVKNG